VALVEQLEKPLPKPGRDLLGYASARVLEALFEALLALEFLERCYTRNAAGKAFQAWKALTGALLALERDRLLASLEGEEARWLAERAIPRVPSSRMKALGQLLERIGYVNYTHYTSTALDLHDYQYRGPDPDMELSKYRSRREAAEDVKLLLVRLAELIEAKVKGRLEKAGKWTKSHEEALEKLREKLKA
jgi:hypothetical protein